MSLTRVLRTTLAVALFAALFSAAGIKTAPPAEAQALAPRARIQCEAGRVKVYSPAISDRISTRANGIVLTATVLYRWTGTSWTDVANSGWWAYAVTGSDGRAFQFMAGSAWRDMSNNIAMFHPFRVTSGYYAAVTYTYDATDGTFASSTNTLDVGNPNAGYWCQA